MLLAQDEAQFPMVPTLRSTLAVKGERPVVGNDDGKDRVYLFGALNLTQGKLTTRMVEKPAKEKKPHLLQDAFARHLEDIARAYPVEQYPRVVLVIDNAPWHKGAKVNRVLGKHSHLELYRLPSYSPKLNVIERFWKVLRRRATHNRYFKTMADLRRALRHSLCYYQTLKHRVLSLIESSKKRSQRAAA